MKLTELTVQEGAFERAVDKRARLNNLYNEQVRLRELWRNAIEEQDQERADEIEAKLGRLSDMIDTLAESVSQRTALTARLKVLKAELEELPQHPTDQEGYDALDDINHEISTIEDKLKNLVESVDPAASYEAARARADTALKKIEQHINKFSLAQKQNAGDWGYVGTLEHAATQLEEIAAFFGT